MLQPHKIQENIKETDLLQAGIKRGADLEGRLMKGLVQAWKEQIKENAKKNYEYDWTATIYINL